MLLIVAPEYSYINNILEVYKYEKLIKNNQTIFKCSYNEHDFLVASTGYGKVNITNALSVICNNFDIKVILIIGTCGSVSDCNDIFNVSIFNSALQYDVDFSPIGYSPGVIPDMKTGIFPTNIDLRKCAEHVCKKFNITYTNDLIASGDMYVCNNGLGNSIRIEYDAGVVDNESGVIGQFCYLNKIPYIGIKVISNFAFNSSVKQYNLYNEEANILSQKITKKFIKEYYS